MVNKQYAVVQLAVDQLAVVRGRISEVRSLRSVYCHFELSSRAQSKEQSRNLFWLRVKGGLVNKQYAVVQLAVV